MSELIVKCELCDEIISKTTEEALSFPMTGAMFQSPDPEHGIPAPFDPILSWEDFRCPHGRTHRPFISQEVISTTTGPYRVSKNGAPGEFVDKRPEIDRESVIDRTIVPTDEQAASTVRAELNKNKAPEKKPNTQDLIKCDVCGRSFQQRGYLSHRNSHKDKE